MSRYRKIPIEIEAVQFTRKNLDEVMEFTNNQIEITTEKRINGLMFGSIETLEGTMRVNENDYIIKGIKRRNIPLQARYI